MDVGKGTLKNVDLSTMSVDDFMNSTLDESADSDIDNDNSPDYVTRAMNEDHQEEGMYCPCVYLRKVTKIYMFVTMVY
jgi:hypothetical protein